MSTIEQELNKAILARKGREVGERCRKRAEAKAAELTVKRWSRTPSSAPREPDRRELAAGAA